MDSELDKCGGSTVHDNADVVPTDDAKDHDE